MEGNGYIIKDESLKAEGKIVFEKPKSYSIIAMNLETAEDVDKVIRQCESIKEQMTGGLVDNLKLRQFLDVPPIKFVNSNTVGNFYPIKDKDHQEVYED